MNKNTFDFNGRKVAFMAGESIASALTTAGIYTFGKDASGRDTRYFCGIGACQCCLIRIDGRVTEACLTPAQTGLKVISAGESNA